MKKYLTLLSLALVFVAAKPVQSPHDSTQEKMLKEQGVEWRQEMNAMLNDVASLVTEPEKGMYENVLNKKQGERILQSIDRLKKMDQEGVFKGNLESLEKLTQSLMSSFKLKDDAVSSQISQEIFNTCFTCHQERKIFSEHD